MASKMKRGRKGIKTEWIGREEVWKKGRTNRKGRQHIKYERQEEKDRNQRERIKEGGKRGKTEEEEKTEQDLINKCL